MESETLPPHDLPAERAALACILDCEQAQAVQNFRQIEERHFYGEQAREIFRAMTQIEADGADFNAVELTERLKTDGRLEAAGGIAAIADLTVPSAANFPSYLEILNDRAARREAIKAADIAIREAQNLSMPFGVVATKATLLDRLAARIYSPQVKPDEPVARLFLAGVPITTPGNLTTVSAPAKAGKSAAIGAMISSTFASIEADCLGFKSQNPDGFAVVHLDTEQCLFDHWQSIQRMMKRALVESAPPWLRSFCITGFCAADVRAAIRLAMEQSAKQFGGIHSVFVDGIADAAQDVNDPAESNGLIAELHDLAIKFDCPIVNIIHINPGSDFKTRGHLGSQLERKSETNLRLEKDDNGVTVIWADKNRRAPIPKAAAPRFAWSEEAKMHVSTSSIGSIKQAANLAELRDQCREAFSLAHRPALSWTDLVQTLRKVPGVKSQRTAERIHTDAKQEGIIVKNIIGQWELSA